MRLHRLVIQVREHPYRKGCKTRSLVIEDVSVDKAMARVDLLYAELQKHDQARIIFHR